MSLDNEREWFAGDNPDQLLELVCDRRREERGIGADGAPARVWPRKRRLFHCGCCRRLGALLPSESARFLDLAESLAEGLAEGQRATALDEINRIGKALDRDHADFCVTALAWKAIGLTFLALRDEVTCIDFFYIGEIPFVAEDDDDGGFTAPANHALLALAAADNDPAIMPLVSMWNRLRREMLPEPAENWHCFAELVAQCNLLRDIFGNPFRPVTIEPALLTWRDATIPKLAQVAYDERELPSGHLDAKRLAILADALEEAGCANEDVLAHLRGPGPHVRGCWVVDVLLGRE